MWLGLSVIKYSSSDKAKYFLFTQSFEGLCFVISKDNSADAAALLVNMYINGDLTRIGFKNQFLLYTIMQNRLD